MDIEKLLCGVEWRVIVVQINTVSVVEDERVNQTKIGIGMSGEKIRLVIQLHPFDFIPRVELCVTKAEKFIVDDSISRDLQVVIEGEKNHYTT